jgi:hypothetical protein
VKKLLTILFFFIVANNIYAQLQPIATPIDSFATHWYSATNVALTALQKYPAYGVLFNDTWKSIEPALNTWDFNSEDSLIDSAIADNKYISFLFYVGQNSPQWVLDSVGSYLTVGVPAQPGPYPRYYNPAYISLFYKFQKGVLQWMDTLSNIRKHQILYWQIAEGSTGDEQPYKGVLDSCQGSVTVPPTCTAADTLSQPALGDPYVPQSRDDPAWPAYRYNDWDTVARSPLYMSSGLDSIIHLMFNSGNDGSDASVIDGDSVEMYNNLFVLNNFNFLPLKPYTKQGQLSHLYAFRGEQSYLARMVPVSRGEVQGYLKKTTAFSAKQLFTLQASAGTGYNFKMFNIDQGWPNVVTRGTQPYITNFFSTMRLSSADGYSMPTLKIDFTDTLRYPTNTFGPVNAQDSASQAKIQRGLYHYWLQAATVGFNPDFCIWEYYRIISKYPNPSRVAMIDSLFPNALYGNQTDSIYYSDHVVNAQYEYHNKLHFTNITSAVYPLFRQGNDSDFFGRFAAEPILDHFQQCTWYYDVDSSVAVTPLNDSLAVYVTYLDNNSGGTFDISQIRCGIKFYYGSQTITTNTGKWLTKVFYIPNIQWNFHGYDFMIDFNGGATTTIGLVTIHNITKAPANMPNYGMFVLSRTSPPLTSLANRIHRVDSLQLQWYRLNENYNSSTNTAANIIADIQQVHALGLLCQLTFNYTTPIPQGGSGNFAHAVDTGGMGAVLDAINSVAPPDMWVNYNEPSTSSYWIDTSINYIPSLICTYQHCAKYNVPFSANTTTQSGVYALYDYYTRINLKDSLSFLQSWSGIGQDTGTFAQHQINFFNTISPVVATLNNVYTDIHYYAPFGSNKTDTTWNPLFFIFAKFVSNLSGSKPLTMTEFGNDNNNYTQLTNLLNDAYYLRIYLQEYYDGDNSGAAVNNTPAYVQFVNSKVPYRNWQLAIAPSPN